MRVQLVSDLHLEFGREANVLSTGADVLVLAGDVCVAKNIGKQMGFFDDVCSRFESVVYVAGNHEHYRGTLSKTVGLLRKALARYDNLHVLDNEYVDLRGVRFVGSTLWSAVDVSCPVKADKMKLIMNDFHAIKYCDDKGNYRKFSPYDVYREHKVSRLFLEGALAAARDDRRDCVVVTHHAPSLRSIHAKYADETDMNTLYATDLEYLMTDNVKLWCHGHTHTAFDYTIGGTRVVCNPRGYPGENSGVSLGLVIDV